MIKWNGQKIDISKVKETIANVKKNIKETIREVESSDEPIQDVIIKKKKKNKEN